MVREPSERGQNLQNPSVGPVEGWAQAPKSSEKNMTELRRFS